VAVVEGELDALLAGQELAAGRDSIQVVTLGGASQSPNPATAAALARCPQLYLAQDGDVAGDTACGRLLRQLGLELGWRVRRVRPPDGKDLTDVHREVGDLRAWFLDRAGLRG
jgi:hypothetical protein